MLRKMCMNVVFLCLRGGRSFLLPLICVALLSAVGAVNYPPLAGAQGVDSYTKLMIHADGSDQGTSFTDSDYCFEKLSPVKGVLFVAFNR